MYLIYQKNINACFYLYLNVLVWVDENLMASNDENFYFKHNRSAKFQMKDLGEVSCFLGVEVHRENGMIKMMQRKYLNV